VDFFGLALYISFDDSKLLMTGFLFAGEFDPESSKRLR